MGKSTVVITAVVVFTISGLAFAQIDDKGKDTTGDKAEMMEAKGGMMRMMGMMGMMHEMMGSMMERKMIATSDGGVVVINGTKLDKFDKDLNLVKETDLKPDTAGMQSMMGQMMGKGRKMMDLDNDDNDKDSAANKPDEDHAAHH